MYGFFGCTTFFGEKLMKKYTASIGCFDNDYHSYVGSDNIEFDEVKEAYEYASKESWSGYSYTVLSIYDNETKEFIKKPH